MKVYGIVFYNRFMCQYQSVEIVAANKFRAGREFYRKFPKSSYYADIEMITGGYAYEV